MRILIVNYEYPPLGGGGGVATQQVAEELAKRPFDGAQGKHEVHVVTTLMRGLPRQEVARGVRIHRVRVLGRNSRPTASIRSMVTFVLPAFWKGVWLLRAQSFDVIHAQFAIPSGLPAAALARFFRVPLVVTFVGGDIYDPSKGTSPHRHRVLRALVRWVGRQAQARTAISQDIANKAKDMHGVTGSIFVTHLGLIPRAVSARSRKELNLPENVPLFVSIGRLIPRKGYEALLTAWSEVPDANLIILGSGPLRAKLQTKIAELGLTDRVQLRGFVSEEEKLQILRASDGYVSATIHEGFGIVFLEAMEAGLPIVTTEIGGQRDFLTEGENAILVPSDDSKQLAAGVRWLLRDQALCERMGKNNREKVKKFYVEKTAARYEQILLESAELRSKN